MSSSIDEITQKLYNELTAIQWGRKADPMAGTWLPRPVASPEGGGAVAAARFQVMQLSQYNAVGDSARASEGIPDVLELVKPVRERFNPKLQIAGILLTMYQSRPQLCRSDRESVGEIYGDNFHVFEWPIEYSIKVADCFEILAGHNRTSAARFAGWSEVPAEIVDADDAYAIVITTSTNLIQRQGITIIERGKAYKALLEAKNRKGWKFELEKITTSGENRLMYSAQALVAKFFGVTE